MVRQHTEFKNDSRAQLITGIVLILILGLVLLVGVINSGFVTESITSQPQPDIEYQGTFVESVYDGTSNVLYNTEDSDVEPDQQLDEVDFITEQTIAQFSQSYVGQFSVTEEDVQEGTRIEQDEKETLESPAGDSYILTVGFDARRLEITPSDNDDILVESTPNGVDSSDAFSLSWNNGLEEYITYVYMNENTDEKTIQTVRNGETIYVDTFVGDDTFELFTGTKNGESIYTTQTGDDAVTISVENGDAIESELFVVTNPVLFEDIIVPQEATTSDTVYSIVYTIEEQTPQQTTTYQIDIQPCDSTADVCSYDR